MPARSRNLGPASWLVSAGRPERPGASVNTPPVPVSNYRLGAGRVYARADGSPTWEALEAVVGGLEGGEAVAFASGMAAVAAVFDELPVGSRVALPEDCYHGVAKVAEAGRQKGRWALERIAVTDTASWVAACRSCQLVWLESPSNPLLQVADLAAICRAPRPPGATLAVDNTFATPLNQRPLALGADVVVHSATKLIGGHSDLLAGVLAVRDPGQRGRYVGARERRGGTPGVLEAYLAVRGARTLALRLERAQANAGELAERLTADRRVEQVRYPGLPDDPGHALARAQLGGFGTIVSFVVRGGGAAADALCGRLELVVHATSLGGVESTIERRGAQAGQEHIPPGLLRLSVGIEDVEDLWHDLDAALQAADATNGG